MDANALINNPEKELMDLLIKGKRSNKMDAKQRVVVNINNLRSVAVVVTKYERYKSN